MDNFEKLLKEYGQNQNVKKIIELVSSTDTEELCDYMENRICQCDSFPVWNYLLDGFTDSSSSQKKRFLVVKKVLDKLRTQRVTNNHEETIVQRLAIELLTFKTKYLVSLVDFCIESIQAGEINGSMSWKDLLPILLNVLSNREKIEYSDTEMTSAEFRKQIINMLCMQKWPVHMVISLTAMFAIMDDNSLISKDEHLRIVHKLGKSMDSMTPQEIPVFTYQLLQFCKNQNGKAVILRLKDYFGKHLYSSINRSDSDSNETNYDLIENANDSEIVKAENTVLYHINQSASVDHGCIKEYINTLKIVSKSPEHILHPFQIIVLLSISCSPHYKESAVELIKYAISKSIIEDQKRVDSAWFREVVPPKLNVQLVFETILNSNLKERTLVVEGLFYLAFDLLTASLALGREFITEKLWKLSYLILTTIVKKRRDIAPELLKELRNNIITESSIAQYSECLYRLCRSSPLEILENQNLIVQLIEQKVELLNVTSVSMIRAVLPLMKISFNIRNSLVLILRKALYARDVGTRQMAVVGLLELLENLKVYNLLALSQSECSNSSGRSVLSQISIEYRNDTPNQSAHSNEVLCLEILDVLKKCFMLQAEVKTQLYDGLYSAIFKNRELQTHALELILSHLNKYYDENKDPPLQLEDMTQIKDTEVVLKEPLGKFIFVIGLIVSKLREDGAVIKSLTMLQEILNNLVNQMAHCELAQFHLDNGTDLLDIMPESQKKLWELKQIILIYEALISYRMLSWDKNSDSGLQVLQLFKAYLRFTELAKSLGKKKETTKRKQDDTFQKPTSSKTPVFKFEPHIMNLQVMEKVLSLLYLESVDWSNKTQANHLKTNRDFNQFIMNTTMEILPTITKTKFESDHTVHYYKNCTNIAKVIYTRCIKRLSDLADFDRLVAANALEIFYYILNLICTQYKKKLTSFLEELDSSASKDKTSSEQIFPFIGTFEEILENEDVEADEEQGIKRNGLIIIKILTLFINQLPVSSVYFSQVLEWIKKYSNEHTNCNKTTSTSLLNLLFSLQLRCKTAIQTCGTHATSLFDNIAVQISQIIGVVEQANTQDVPNSIQLIKKDTALNVLQSLCNVLKSQLDDVNWIILRLRADYHMITHPGGESLERKREKLKSNEFDLCAYVCQLVELCLTISNIAVPPGGISETVLKLLAHLYNTLGSLTKYFIVRSSKESPIFQNARFDKVIQITGKHLSNNVYGLILFIEESQQQQSNVDDTTQQSKKRKVDTSQSKSKVLRDTRFIPKLVYEIEQFGKFVIQLSTKTKIDLKRYIKTGKARDYRIRVPALKDALDNVGGCNDTTIVDDEDDSVTNIDANEENISDNLDSVSNLDAENSDGSDN